MMARFIRWAGIGPLVLLFCAFFFPDLLLPEDAHGLPPLGQDLTEEDALSLCPQLPAGLFPDATLQALDSGSYREREQATADLTKIALGAISRSARERYCSAERIFRKLGQLSEDRSLEAQRRLEAVARKVNELLRTLQQSFLRSWPQDLLLLSDVDTDPSQVIAAAYAVRFYESLDCTITDIECFSSPSVDGTMRSGCRVRSSDCARCSPDSPADGCVCSEDFFSPVRYTETRYGDEHTGFICRLDINSLINPICGAPGSAHDFDGDGVEDCAEGCPDNSEKSDPGQCGCGTPDTDSDGDGTADCHDACSMDPSKIEEGACGCGTPDADSDGDGTPDCIDACPEDTGKIALGLCGCNVPDTDSDEDGAPDACTDECPYDPEKTQPGICGCGVRDDDYDGDGTADCLDRCPADPGKVEEGACGCGTVDDDEDSDGSPDLCGDECPEDPQKTAAGTCGCGTPDSDTDGDGTADCLDACPDDAGKTATGICGCGLADIDSDADGAADCQDECPDDPEKTEAGDGGCHQPECAPPNILSAHQSVNYEEEQEIALSLCGGVNSGSAISDDDLAALGSDRYRIRLAKSSELLSRFRRYLASYPERRFCEEEYLRRVFASALQRAGNDLETEQQLTALRRALFRDLNAFLFPFEGETLVSQINDSGGMYLRTGVARREPFVGEYKVLEQWTQNGCRISGIVCSPLEGNEIDPTWELGNALFLCSAQSPDCTTNLQDGRSECTSFSWGPVQRFWRLPAPQQDGCPADPEKEEPGICGCGVPDTDSDGDGVPDACGDECPTDPQKVSEGLCGCGTADDDTDGDGAPDLCEDECPTDPNKASAGTCGCDMSDADSDGDDTPDCFDGCPEDGTKTAAGTCGCGVPDTDSDGDGVADCQDECPEDAVKAQPGLCGCGTGDDDRDGDGAPDCSDQCPDDAVKVEPGVCGCDASDDDTDGDGSVDCTALEFLVQAPRCPDPDLHGAHEVLNYEEEKEIALLRCGGDEIDSRITQADLDALGHANFQIRAAKTAELLVRFRRYIAEFPTRRFCEEEVLRRVFASAAARAGNDLEIERRLIQIHDTLKNGMEDLLRVRVSLDDGPFSIQSNFISGTFGNTLETDVTRPDRFVGEFKVLEQWEQNGCTVQGVYCRRETQQTDPDWAPVLQGVPLWTCEGVSTTCRTRCGQAPTECTVFDWGPVNRFCRIPQAQQDQCPDDPDKAEPGQCGCGVPETDLDLDGTPDCLDSCPTDAAKTSGGVCGCGATDTDFDNDGTPDCIDPCSMDPNKVEEGVCGCGTADTDSDSDGTADCIDPCSMDPNKIEEGVCGCGTAETDSDSDGTADCHDRCPNDPSKIEPGACGCDVAESDSDGDGTVDCLDGCMNDPDKIEPGVCGCGAPDDDGDADGVADCHDLCGIEFDPDQLDTDGDSLGDSCDLDADGDGFDDGGSGGGPSLNDLITQLGSEQFSERNAAYRALRALLEDKNTLNATYDAIVTAQPQANENLERRRRLDLLAEYAQPIADWTAVLRRLRNVLGNSPGLSARRQEIIQLQQNLAQTLNAEARLVQNVRDSFDAWNADRTNTAKSLTLALIRESLAQKVLEGLRTTRGLSNLAFNRFFEFPDTPINLYEFQFDRGGSRFRVFFLTESIPATGSVFGPLDYYGPLSGGNDPMTISFESYFTRPQRVRYFPGHLQNFDPVEFNRRMTNPERDDDGNEVAIRHIFSSSIMRTITDSLKANARDPDVRTAIEAGFADLPEDEREREWLRWTAAGTQ